MNLGGLPVNEAVFNAMTDILAHRGPNDKGIQYFEGVLFVALRHRRLETHRCGPLDRKVACQVYRIL